MNTRSRKSVRRLLIALSLVFVGLFLVLPLVFVFAEAFSDGVSAYLEYISDTYTQRALLLTVEATLIAVVVNTFFGLFAAWVLTRYRFVGQKLLTTMIDIPLSVSPVIAGLIYLLCFGRSSPLYGFILRCGTPVVFAVPGIVLCTIFVTFPFISRELIPVLNARGTDEEQAAALLGAGGWTIFRRITLPHIKWPLLYGIILCTARAMGEFGAVSVISGRLRGLTNTLPLHIEILYNEFKYAPAFAVASVLVIMAVLLLLIRCIVEYQGRKKEQ